MEQQKGKNKLCGLIGYIGYEPNHEQIIEATVDAMRSIQHRGKDSWGLNVNGQLYRDLGTIEPDEIKTHLGTHLKTQVGKAAKPNFIIGHVRTKTVGNISINNAHPFLQHRGKTFNPLTLAHNGTVNVDFKDCAQKFEPGESDTAKLTRAVAEHGFGVLKRVTGSAAILAATEKNFFAYGDPMWRARSPYGGVCSYIFGSIRSAVDAWKSALQYPQWAECVQQDDDELFTLSPSGHRSIISTEKERIQMKASYRCHAAQYTCNTEGWGEWRDVLMDDDDSEVKIRTKNGIASSSGVKPAQNQEMPQGKAGTASVTKHPVTTEPLSTLKKDTNKNNKPKTTTAQTNRLMKGMKPAQVAKSTVDTAKPPAIADLDPKKEVKPEGDKQGNPSWKSTDGKKSAENDTPTFLGDVSWVYDIEAADLSVLKKLWEDYLQYTPSLLMEAFFDQTLCDWLTKLVDTYTDEIWDMAIGDPKK